MPTAEELSAERRRQQLKLSFQTNSIKATQIIKAPLPEPTR